MSHFFIIKLCTNIVLLSDYKDFKCWLQMFAFISLETSNSFYIGTGLRGSQFESHWFGAFRLTKTIRITHRTQSHWVTGILLYVVATDVNNSCYLHSMISFLKCLRVHTPIYLQDRYVVGRWKFITLSARGQHILIMEVHVVKCTCFSLLFSHIIL